MRIWVVLPVLLAPSLQAGMLDLKPETLQSWDEYIHHATAALRARGGGGRPFLWIDDNPERLSSVRKGEIVIWPIGENNPKPVPYGLIHDWRAAVFVPNARAEDLLSVVRNYADYKEIYKPGVLNARLLSQKPDEDRFSMLLRNGSYFTKTVIDGEYQSSYVQLDDKRGYSVSCSTRVQEIDNYGQSEQRELPADRGHGYIWRICGFSQYEERDGGIYLDEEMIALSRDVPAMVRWMIDPIIRRVSRESLSLSVDKTRTAVAARAADTTISAKRSGAGALQPCRSLPAVGCMR